MARNDSGTLVKIAEIDTEYYENPRIFRTKGEISDIIASIKHRKALGLPPLMQPVGLERVLESERKPGEKPFRMLFGWGRIQAVSMAGETEIQAVFETPLSRATAFATALQENLKRAALKPVEIVLAAGKLRDQYKAGGTGGNREVGECMGYDGSHVRNLLRIYDSTLVREAYIADTIAGRQPILRDVIGVVKVIPGDPASKDAAVIEAREKELKAQLDAYRKLVTDRESARTAPDAAREGGSGGGGGDAKPEPSGKKARFKVNADSATGFVNRVKRIRGKIEKDGSYAGYAKKDLEYLRGLVDGAAWILSGEDKCPVPEEAMKAARKAEKEEKPEKKPAAK